MLPEICVYPSPWGSPRNSYSLASPPQLNLKMGSIPGASQGVDINYNKPRDHADNLSSGLGSPFSPTDSLSSPSTSWEESMMQLSRDLKVICRSPDRYDMPAFPHTTTACGAMSLSGPTSPIMTMMSTGTTPTTNKMATAKMTAASALSSASPTLMSSSSEVVMHDVGKLLNVRHVQSEEKLREKLSSICRSPRRSRSSMFSSGDSDSAKLKPSKMAASGSALGLARAAVAKRRALHAFPYFKANVDIGDHTIEDLSVLVEAHQLKVFSERKAERGEASHGNLLTTVDLPLDVNPKKLICIVHEGVLEVKESKRKCPPANKMLGRQLSMSCTTSGYCGESTRHAPGVEATICGVGCHHPDQCPIVIEDDGSHLLKLVLRVPPGYKFEDLQIKTVDNQLVVSGRRGPQWSLSASFCPPSWNKENSHHDDRSFTNVFELPASVDPYSMTARLTDQHQLIIQATLSPATRSNTL